MGFKGPFIHPDRAKFIYNVSPPLPPPPLTTPMALYHHHAASLPPFRSPMLPLQEPQTVIRPMMMTKTTMDAMTRGRCSTTVKDLEPLPRVITPIEIVWDDLAAWEPTGS